jgi:Fur family ferric uptake transcriptional regulator
MYPEIGHTTVFRTLKLLEEAGIARSVELGDRRVRYEHKFQHAHHDHLICRYCGASFEVFDSEIERLQNELCRRNSFRPEAHRLEIFGMCARCAELRRSNQ